MATNKFLNEEISDEEFEPQGEGLFEPGEVEVPNWRSNPAFAKVNARFDKLGHQAGLDLYGKIHGGAVQVLNAMGVKEDPQYPGDYSDYNEYFDICIELLASYLLAMQDEAAIIPFEDLLTGYKQEE